MVKFEIPLTKRIDIFKLAEHLEHRFGIKLRQTTRPDELHGYLGLIVQTRPEPRIVLIVELYETDNTELRESYSYYRRRHGLTPRQLAELEEVCRTWSE